MTSGAANFAVLRSDANVAVQSDLEAAAESPTFHRRDKRLAKGVELERIIDRIAPRPGVGEIVERMKVRAGAKCALARSAHQHAADVAVRFQGRERLANRGRHRGRDRIVLRGAIEDEFGDPAAGLFDLNFIDHAAAPVA